MPDYIVREAEQADASGIQRVARAGWHAAYDDAMGSDTVDDCIDDWYDHETVAGAITDDDIDYLVATAEDRVVGYASAGPTDDDRPEAVAGLYSIYVHPDRWGAGIGTTLLERCTGRLRERGFEHLCLRVIATNEVGISFYRSHGFEKTGEEAAELKGQSLDEYEFARAL
ncbi:GNAT family N-acetyltransferase [Haloarchaeobius iranensis]|uniref:L-amino acid N-acyltransferase YncA n=1 Tax=Haloarchaeobius iranensis TaxID=996166 RepID=A0A1H0B8H0_9EURY|nr:GNAT family N-acetyltransferase [Haloarchaeobius iranensis]SDN41936.1 L-amino acid N-acyltransferase YncA [Haloarchaeobius iranensis]